jgi:hypothetical protein
MPAACRRRRAVVFRLDECEGKVRLVIEDIVGAFGLPTSDELAPNDDSAFGKPDLFANLSQLIPPCLFHCRRDEFRADGAFAQGFLIEIHHL